LLSATCYGTANILLRLSTEWHIDREWTLCMKEMVTIIALVPWILWRTSRGKYPWPAVRLIVIMIFVAIAVQWIGARLHLWSYGIIGLVVATPLMTSSVLLSGATFGKLGLKESVSWRDGLAIVLLITSIVLLSIGRNRNTIHEDPDPVPAAVAASGQPVDIGAKAANHWHARAHRADLREREKLELEDAPGEYLNGLVLLAVLAILLTGVTYALNVSAIRYVNQFQMPVTLTMLIVPGIGFLGFGYLVVRDHGLMNLTQAPLEFWLVAFGAGVANFMAFGALILGLYMTKVVRAALINASQIAMVTLVGVLFFAETAGLFVFLGVVLTIVGMVLISRADPDEIERQRAEEQDEMDLDAPLAAETAPKR
jgi:drug/metabolite transporter (DMT)-like permease